MTERCDAAISGVGGVSDWPCMLEADHRGKHLYDTGVDARVERDRYKALAESLPQAVTTASLRRLELDVAQLRTWAYQLDGKAAYALANAADLLESAKVDWHNTASAI